MIYQKLKPNMMSPLTKMMLKKNPLNPVQLCLQELKDHRPKRFWHVIHIITQVQVRNAIPVKWIFKRKLGAKDQVCRDKARLVCKGFCKKKDWTPLRPSRQLPSLL